jgi:peroxiredoxin
VAEVGTGDAKRPKGRTKIATETKTLKVGDPAPDFTLRAHDGRTITLSALRGQRVVLAFMAFAFSGT